MASASERPLSERPKGYALAVLGGSLGGFPGLIVSPLVLFLLNKQLKRNKEKSPNRFRAWALIGMLGAPICGGIQAAIVPPDPSVPSVSTGGATAPSTPSEPEAWDSDSKGKELEASIRENAANQLTGVGMRIQSASCYATSDKGFWMCSIRKLGDSESRKWRVEVADDGTWASSPVFD